ncbi:MAG: hypothetical protein JWP30_1013 [Homoserinimonas sp.]|jgi:hypothetical protein|nr:hypothetical protein [Homoserinimonas sp.]
MAKQQSITSLPRSPEDDRRARMIRYSAAMGIRLVCIIACFFVDGWWLVLPVLGAVLLPYVAVVLANVSSSRVTTVVDPGRAALTTLPPFIAPEEPRNGRI